MLNRVLAQISSWNESLMRRAIWLQNEKGAEAIEWIAMAAVVIILLAAVSLVFKQEGKTIGELLIGAIVTWIAKMFAG